MNKNETDSTRPKHVSQSLEVNQVLRTFNDDALASPTCGVINLRIRNLDHVCKELSGVS
jgi:hypothetical protein